MSVIGCVCAVIPCYNEELVIGSLVLKSKSKVDHVIVVNDGSSDSTANIARLAGAEVLDFKINNGKAHALMKGIEYAKNKGCMAVVLLDGDGQHQWNEIPDLLEPILSDKADLVIGSRFLNYKNNIPHYRIFGQKILNLATNICNNNHRSYLSSDSQSGFRALGLRALENMNFSSEGFNIESDMISHMSEKGIRIYEVPILVRYDTPNNHKLNPVKHGLQVFLGIIRHASIKKPLTYFGIPGVLFCSIGFFSGIYVLSEFQRFSIFHYVIAMMSLFIVIFGLLLFTSGLILDSIVRTTQQK
ncbi:MAG: glycosyltransferase [Methanomicrobiaceae archaeon]|nr:glycosyltransferase [Methanomicrobiaceae archaeon]